MSSFTKKQISAITNSLRTHRYKDQTANANDVTRSRGEWKFNELLPAATPIFLANLSTRAVARILHIDKATATKIRIRLSLPPRTIKPESLRKRLYRAQLKSQNSQKKFKK